MSPKKERVIGNSGCKLNIFKDKIFKIRKQSSSLTNSDRLLGQYKKILNFKSFKNILVPKIFKSGKFKKLFFYDMQYINGSTLSLFLINQPFSESKNKINTIIEYIFYCKETSKIKYKKTLFLKKIKDLNNSKVFKDFFFKKIFNKLNKYEWNNIEKSSSHGDLSLENIIIKENKIVFIDLSQNFVDSFKLDISKLIFDIISLWSFRKTNLQFENLNIFALKIYLIKIITKKLKKKDMDDIKMLIILDFLRVMIYTKNKNEIKFLKIKLKNFYANIDNPLRW